MPNITLLEQHTLVDLITSRKLGLPGPQRCLGLYALDGATDEVITFRAPHTILATGGAGKVYLYTTNPRHRHGRWHRRRVAGRVPGGEPGVHPVSPHLPVPPE